MPEPELDLKSDANGLGTEHSQGRFGKRSHWPLGLPRGGADEAEDLPIESAIICHIFVLNSVLERIGNRVAEAHSLTLPQWMALGCIGHAHESGLTHSELGQRLMLSKAPITGVVDRLERAGLVTRTTSESDRRVSRIHTTEVGVLVWREVRDNLRAQSMRYCEALGEEGKAQMLSLLSALLEQVAASDPMLCSMRAARERRQAPPSPEAAPPSEAPRPEAAGPGAVLEAIVPEATSVAHV